MNVCSRCVFVSCVSRNPSNGWCAVTSGFCRSSRNARCECVRTYGFPRTGSRRAAYLESRFPFTSHIPDSCDSSWRRCIRSKVALRAPAWRSCGTRLDTRSSMRIDSIAVRNGVRSSAHRELPTPIAIARIAAAGATFDIFQAGTRRVIRMRILQRHSPCGCVRGHVGAHATPGGPSRSQSLRMSIHSCTTCTTCAHP